MAQTFTSTDVVTTTNVFGDNQSQRVNENTLRSSFSGPTQPSDPVVGQVWYDTINNKQMQYNGTAWVPVDTNGTTQVDVSNAKGNLTSLTSYLRVAHNDDGTLKTSPATAIDEFKDNALVITYVSANTFTVPMDLTSIFTNSRKLKVYLENSAVITYVLSSSYSSGTNRTTVVTGDTVLNSSVTAIKYSIIQYGMPQDYNLVLEESTGYGVISGGSATVSELTVTIAAVVAHMPNGIRYSLPQSTITVNAADATNPRIDLIYLSSSGVVSYLAGAAAVSPSVPIVPNGGLALSKISVAANATTGTVMDLRSIKARWQNTSIVNVKDFGAIGDGITDDTVAIQAAVNSATKGSVVILPSATYLITSIKVPSAVSIMGLSRDNVIIKQASGRVGAAFISVDTESPAISNLTINSTNAIIEGGIIFAGVNNGIVNNVVIENPDYAALCITGNGFMSSKRVSKNCVVENCEEYGQRTWPGNGTAKASFIAGDGSLNTKFINCYAHDQAADAYDADNAPNTQFVGCKAQNIGNCGFWSEGQESGIRTVTFTNCIAISCGIGFGIAERTDVIMAGCVIDSCGTMCGGIWFRGSKGSVTGCKFTGSGKDSYNGAMYIENPNITVSDCQFTGSIGADLTVYSGAGAITGSAQIMGNTFSGAVWLQNAGGITEAVVSSNTFASGSYLTWYNAGGCFFSIVGNVFLNSYISGSRVGQAIVTGNTFIDSSGTLTAISCNIDTYNTYIDNNIFNGYNKVTDNGTLGKNIYKNITNPPTIQLDYMSTTTINLAAGVATSIPGTSTRGAFLLVVTGTGNDLPSGLYACVGGSYTSNHTVTTLAQVPSYGTSNYFTVAWPAGGNITISHVNAMTVKVSIIAVN